MMMPKPMTSSRTVTATNAIACGPGERRVIESAGQGALEMMLGVRGLDPHFFGEGLVPAKARRVGVPDPERIALIGGEPFRERAVAQQALSEAGNRALALGRGRGHGARRRLASAREVARHREHEQRLNGVTPRPSR